MNREKDSKQNENVFIGARVLGEDGIKLVLPTYDVLISQIEQMKSVAKNSEKQNSNISRVMKYNREHNNTIAIFGKRGTGKTSAVYTLMDYLLNQNTRAGNIKNIVLPIIEPDNFGDNTKIMGSIVGLIKNEVEEILKEVKCLENKSEPYFRNCIYVENNPLKQKMDELLEHHMYSDSEYRNIITHNYTDTATHIKKSSHLLIPDINLKHKFWDVIDEIVKIYKNEINKDVMLFIFIDDIDLKTTKCKELIEAIMQFSSHPNVITILSGDYEILEEGVMLSLIGDENLREKGLDSNFIIKKKMESIININESIETGVTIKDRKLDLAENYLKKIIPPSRRHHVVDWNIDNIPSFSFGKTKLIDKIYEFYNGDNIFGFKDNELNISSTKYPYIIFDNKPRGLINVYYNLSRIVSNDKKSFFDIKLLIDTIIDSSPELLKNKEKFYEFINWGSDFKSTKINYDKIIIEGIENKSLKESLAYFIIAEMLLYYENESSDNSIYYNKDKYDESKKHIIMNLYNNASIEELCENRTSYTNISIDNIYYKNLYNLAITFALNLEFVDSLIFLNMLLESEFKYNYGYKDFWDNSKINAKKDRCFLRSMYKFISLDENNNKEILKKMRIYANENNYSENVDYARSINRLINFVNDLSRTQKNDYILKSKYYDIEKYVGIINENYREPPMINIESVLKYKEDKRKSNELTDIIFLNLMNYIETLDINLENENNIISRYNQQSKLKNYVISRFNKKKLNTLNKLRYYKTKNIKIEERRLITISDRIKRDIVMEFLELIRDKNITYFRIDKNYIEINNDLIYKELYKFMNGYDGKETTNYSVTKSKIINKILEYEIDIKYILNYQMFSKQYEERISKIGNNLEGLLKEKIKLKDIVRSGISLKDLIDFEMGLKNVVKSEIALNDLIKSNKTNNVITFKTSDIINLDYKLRLNNIIGRNNNLLWLYYRVKELSESNRIWYGRQEAREFLDFLNSSISIDLQLTELSQYIPLLYYIGKFNELINPELREDIEFEDTKEKMKKLLDDVYSESIEEVIKEYEEFDLDIEDEYQDGL